MYWGDADGEQVNFNPLPTHRKSILSVLIVVVITMELLHRSSLMLLKMLQR